METVVSSQNYSKERIDIIFIKGTGIYNSSKNMLPIILITIFFALVSRLAADVCYLPTSFNCDETSPLCPGATDIVALPETVYNCSSVLTL